MIAITINKIVMYAIREEGEGDGGATCRSRNGSRGADPSSPPLKQDRAAGWVRPYSSSRRPPSPDAAWRAASLVTLHTTSFRCSEQINMLSSYQIMRKKWEGGSRWSHLVTVVLIQPRRPSTHPSQFTNPWVLACLPAPALCPWMPQKQPDL